MQRSAVLSFIVLAIARLTLVADSEGSGTPWKEEGNRDRLVIYSRAHPGSAVREFKSVGAIDAPPSAVFAVLDNAEAYPQFMPYTSESRVLKKTGTYTIAYQRLELPLVDDRDYTLRSKHSRTESPSGPVYHIEWQPANDLGPAEIPGVQRVKVCEGGWLIEPTGDGRTRATYLIYTDSGGAIPAAIANSGSRLAIRKLFAAIRKEVHTAKYAEPQG
ncbi:MAG: SRPBCC family protein [Chthoniobacterales bacterium]